jgi:shikimate kinase
MFDVCPKCSVYNEKKMIDPAGPYAVCPHCGYAHHFRQQPLYVVTGASGAGKSTVCLRLPNRLSDVVCLDMDTLWNPCYNTPEDDYRLFRNTWLRLAREIGQNGLPVVLCGSATPGQFEACPQYRYFTKIHYLVLVCDDDVLAERLRARPAWRQSSTPRVIETMVAYNRWFKRHAVQYDMRLLDTTPISVDETVDSVRDWVEGQPVR